jgi:hypothetical protein
VCVRTRRLRENRPSGAKARKVCGTYGTAEAVPFLRESFRTSATLVFYLYSNRESKARQYFQAVTARLKSCPDTKPSSHAGSSDGMRRLALRAALAKKQTSLQGLSAPVPSDDLRLPRPSVLGSLRPHALSRLFGTGLRKKLVLGRDWVVASPKGDLVSVGFLSRHSRAGLWILPSPSGLESVRQR